MPKQEFSHCHNQNPRKKYIYIKRTKKKKKTEREKTVPATPAAFLQIVKTEYEAQRNIKTIKTFNTSNPTKNKNYPKEKK